MGDKAAAKKLMSEANNDFKALCFHNYKRYSIIEFCIIVLLKGALINKVFGEIFRQQDWQKHAFFSANFDIQLHFFIFLHCKSSH